MTGKLFRNGIEYGGGSGGIATNAYLAQRTVADSQGNNIKSTYLTKEELSASLETEVCLQTSIPGMTHNCVFRGKDITKYYNDGSLWSRISSGKFEDLWVGDYFTCGIGEANAKCRIAGFNIFYKRDGEAQGKPHVVIVPDAPLFNAQMNETHTTEGGYLGSKMRKVEIPKINAWLEARFGAHLLTVKELLTSTVDMTKPSGGYTAWNGLSTGETLVDSVSELMSEAEVYGSRVWSSSALDTRSAVFQYPLFSLAPEFINATRDSGMWLREIAHTRDFSLNGYNGDIYRWPANDPYGVRPRWVLG